MDKRLFTGAVMALLFALCAPVGQARAQATALPARIDLHGGQVAVYKSDRPLARVAVGNGELLEVTTIEKRQIVVIPTAGKNGFTTLHLWYEDGGQRAIDVEVRSLDPNGTIALVLRLLGPDSAAQVTEVGGNVVVTGELRAEEVARLEQIRDIYPNVVDLSTPDLVGMKPTVLMDVRIMEFRRDALRSLGIQWDSVIDGPTAGAVKDFSTSFYRILPDGSPFEDILDGVPRVNPWATYFGLATSISSRINLMTQNGDAYELAAPQLSARSGGSASFLAGGEIPIPIAGAFGSTNVEFRDYGIKLDIEPVVNGNGEISAVVSTEVSKIDPSVSVGGIPGFLTRRTGTEMNVRDGQTMVISGLVDMTGAESLSGIPGLARIPILGRLFRSDDFRAGRTDLVIFVTPRIVTPDHPANIEAIQKSDRMLQDFQDNINADIFD